MTDHIVFRQIKFRAQKSRQLHQRIIGGVRKLSGLIRMTALDGDRVCVPARASNPTQACARKNMPTVFSNIFTLPGWTAIWTAFPPTKPASGAALHWQPLIP